MALVQGSLDGGADVNTGGGLGRTALVWAAISGHTSTIDQLLLMGADAAIWDVAGMKAADQGAKEGHAALAKSLQKVAGSED